MLLWDGNYLSIGQLLSTKLQVVVRNDLGNLVEGATVKIFKTEADYESEKNASGQGQTDDKGKIVLSDLESVIYYIHVEKNDLSNIGRGVQTNKLKAKRKNIVNVIIE